MNWKNQLCISGEENSWKRLKPSVVPLETALVRWLCDLNLLVFRQIKTTSKFCSSIFNIARLDSRAAPWPLQLLRTQGSLRQGELSKIHILSSEQIVALPYKIITNDYKNNQLRWLRHLVDLTSWWTMLVEVNGLDGITLTSRFLFHTWWIHHR